METELKQSLLLTHGTIYGYAAPQLPWQRRSDFSPSLDAMSDQVTWRSGLYPALQPEVYDFGEVTDNATIDFYSWNHDGDIVRTGHEWWEQCMTLFMRHI